MCILQGCRQLLQVTVSLHTLQWQLQLKQTVSLLLRAWTLHADLHIH
jgi:hypothetical protein